MGSDGMRTACFEQVRRTMKDAVEPTLGPATAGDMDLTFCLACDARGRVLSVLGAGSEVDAGGRRSGALRVKGTGACHSCARGVEEGR